MYQYNLPIIYKEYLYFIHFSQKSRRIMYVRTYKYIEQFSIFYYIKDTNTIHYIFYTFEIILNQSINKLS